MYLPPIERKPWQGPGREKDLEANDSLPHLSYSYSLCNGHPSQTIGRTALHKDLLINVLVCLQPTGGFLLLIGDGKGGP